GRPENVRCQSSLQLLAQLPHRRERRKVTCAVSFFALRRRFQNSPVLPYIARSAVAFDGDTRETFTRRFNIQFVSTHDMLEAGPFLLTLKLSLITTLVLFLTGVPIAYWLAYGKGKIKVIVEALVALPIVLPPSVLGFYLLLAFSPQNSFGAWLDQTFDLRLVFTFPGLVIASIIYSLPFMVQPVQAGFQQLPQSLIDASYTLGKGK